MSDTPQVINTLRTKADRLAAHIVTLEAEIEAARRALANVNATIVLFEAPDATSTHPVLMDVNRLFKRREIGLLCAEALKAGPMDTRALALYVIRAKGFDETDRHLRKAVAYRIVQALRLQEKRRGLIQRVEKVSNVVVWQIDTHENSLGIMYLTNPILEAIVVSRSYRYVRSVQALFPR